ncbi:unnamed protein product, partial [Strongylus vulgaris]
MAADGKMPSLCSEVMTDVERRDYKNAVAAYSRIVSFCEQHRTTFVDDIFPHTDESIGDLHAELGPVVGIIPRSFVWLRPEQMFTKDRQAWPWTVFRDPCSSDVEQGVLGNCGLLSAMALIAERPDVLEHILLTKEYSHCGAYQVRWGIRAIYYYLHLIFQIDKFRSQHLFLLRLCIDGQWKIVLVDDFFPCRPATRSIAFAEGRKNQVRHALVLNCYFSFYPLSCEILNYLYLLQLWVPLIEKAL